MAAGQYLPILTPPKGSFFLYGVRGSARAPGRVRPSPMRAIDGRRFVLLGSSARRLKTADTHLLAGRAALRTMYPLVPAELGADFDLARVLRFGSIPVVWQADGSVSLSTPWSLVLSSWS